MAYHVHPMDTPRILLVAAAVAGFTGVAAGAFGAHGLEKSLPPDRLEVFHTAARYHLIHALALVAAAWVASRYDPSWGRAAGFAFVAGIVVFSGSLYGLALSGVRWLGAVTPIGGLAFLAGWFALGVAAFRGR